MIRSRGYAECGTRSYIAGPTTNHRSAAYVLAMDALVQINDVTKRYDGVGQPAVDGITLEIAAG